MITTHYKLEIVPDWNGYNDALLEKLQALAMNKACSPYPIVDVFGRIYTAFCSYRLALDAAVPARSAHDCSIRVHSFESDGDIHACYTLFPQQYKKGEKP